MIRLIQSYEECREFAAGFQNDPSFSDPMLTNEEQLRSNLLDSIGRENRCALGVYQENRMTGLFAFLVLPDEQYLEMLVGLSREKDAYLEVLGHLEQCYPGCNVDFVFNPGNILLKELLEQREAEFWPEQQKLVFTAPVFGLDTTGVELLSPQYTQLYCAMHSKDVYWTGERVAAAQDRFHTFLAIHENRVVGYLDVTSAFDENEPYDLFVLEEYRKMGYGRKLLAKALEWNRPKGMAVLLDVDNAPAIHLYTSMGFVKEQGQNNLTAHWQIPNS